ADVGADHAAQIEHDADMAFAHDVGRAHQQQHGGHRGGDPEVQSHGRASPRPDGRGSRTGRVVVGGLLSTVGEIISGVSSGGVAALAGGAWPGAIGTSISWLPSAPTMVRLPASTLSTVSSHSRLRVTSGAWR